MKSTRFEKWNYQFFLKIIQYTRDFDIVVCFIFTLSFKLSLFHFMERCFFREYEYHTLSVIFIFLFNICNANYV